MTDQKVQTRVTNEMADRIDTFQEGDYMNQSEAIRRLLRDGLDANEPLDEEADDGDPADPEATEQDTATEGTAAIEQAYHFSKQLADAGLAAGFVALGAYVAVALNLATASFGIVLATVTLAMIGLLLTVLSLILAVGLRAVEAATGLDADPQLRRLDLRRVVAS
jgi:Arc/MetJ-type ribon-helix-helix transcriptional regulator